MYANAGSGLQGPLASFELVPTSEETSVGIYEVDLKTLDVDLASLCNGSCSVHISLNSGGQTLWWPWDPGL